MFMKAIFFFLIFKNIFKSVKEPLHNVIQPLKILCVEKNLTRYTLPTKVTASLIQSMLPIKDTLHIRGAGIYLLPTQYFRICLIN